MRRAVNVTSARSVGLLLLLVPIANTFGMRMEPGSLSISSSCGLKADWVTPNFQSTNIAEALKAFKAIKPKGEFETTADYNNRVTKELGGPENFSQCATLWDGSGRYDADKKRMNFEVMPFTKIYYGKAETAYSFIGVIQNVSVDTYNGSNAFGVSKSVTRTRRAQQGVAFTSKSFEAAMRAVGAKFDYEWFNFSLPMAAEKAKAVSKDLTLAVAYTWVPSYRVTKMTYKSPTLDSPSEDFDDGEFLLGKVTRIAVIDKKSGEVFIAKSIP